MVKKNSPQLRIHGLVKAMNIARRNLEEHARRGLSANELKTFDNWVQRIIQQTEQICKQYEIGPEDLPAPSYRAYSFLKSLNIPALKPSKNTNMGKKAARGESQEIHPVTEDTASDEFYENPPRPQKQIRVANLIKICNHLQTQLAQSASQVNRNRKAKRAASRELLAKFQETASQVEQICRDEDGSPSDLPEPSRRAYQWIKFLSIQENLDTHIQALRWAIRAAGQERERANFRRKLAPALQNFPVYFEFFNLPAIYRTKTGREAIQIIANEGFIRAPAKVIEALVWWALLRDRGEYQAIIQEYADSEEFSEVLMAMEFTTQDPETATRGQVYDLDEIFQQVNAQYFQNQLERPNLTWNKTLTYRKFGHYHPASNTLMISITLDQPQVPRSVVEYVMYHEMLHKALGIKVSNGRHYAHHKDFLEAEARFQHYIEAKEWLSRLGDSKSDQTW